MTSVDWTAAQQSLPPSGRLSSTRAQTLLLSLALAVGILAIYYPVHSQPFANYDDPDYVTDNLHVKAGLHWETVTWAMKTRDAANWHPLTWLSHALDCQLFGDDPAGPHDINVAFHLVNALLLFWVLLARDGFHRPQLHGGGTVCAASHQRRIGGLDRRAQEPAQHVLLPADAGRLSLVRAEAEGHRYVVVALLFALGLMSKPQVITLPFVLLLWDYWPLQRISFGGANLVEPESSGGIPKRSLSALIWEKVPLLVLGCPERILTIRAQSEEEPPAALPADSAWKTPSSRTSAISEKPSGQRGWRSSIRFRWCTAKCGRLRARCFCCWQLPRPSRSPIATAT